MEEIRLKGGPYDGAVIRTGENTITYTITVISDNPAVLDYKNYRYVETRETDEAGRRIFEYKPRTVSETVGANVAVDQRWSDTVPTRARIVHAR